MRKITASLYMTLDGRGAFPKYPGSDRETGEPNEMWREMWLNRFDDVTTVIMGRRSFLGHRRVWTEKARKPTDPKYLIDYARWLDHVDKVCLSKRLKSPGWENSRIMKGDLSKIIAKLKKEKGGNIIAEGGPALIREFLRRGLADDYWAVVQPVVYGKGPQVLGSDEGPGDPQAPLVHDHGGRGADAPLRDRSGVPRLARRAELRDRGAQQGCPSRVPKHHLCLGRRSAPPTSRCRGHQSRRRRSGPFSWGEGPDPVHARTVAHPRTTYEPGRLRSLLDVTDHELISVRIGEHTASLRSQRGFESCGFIDNGSAALPDLLTRRPGVVMREDNPRDRSGLAAPLAVPHDVHGQQSGRPRDRESGPRGRGNEGGLLEAQHLRIELPCPLDLSNMY